MSTSRILYSLPKTQPTSNSSSKNSHTTSSKNINSKKQSSDTIQVSEFSINSCLKENNQIYYYTHNMKIDYGKLEKIDYGKIQKKREYLKKQIQKEMGLVEQLNGMLLTAKKWDKTHLNITKSTLNDSEQKEQPLPHLLLLSKKNQNNLKTNSYKNQNPESNRKVLIKKTSKNNKINVTAYEYLKKSLQKNTINQQTNEIQSQNENDYHINTEESKQILKSDRKISHSRIIKTINPSAGIQTKMITYPDVTQMIRINEANKNKSGQKGKWVH